MSAVKKLISLKKDTGENVRDSRPPSIYPVCHILIKFDPKCQTIRCFVFWLQTRQLEPLLNKFTAEEEKQMKRMLQRVDVLAKVRIPEQINVSF